MCSSQPSKELKIKHEETKAHESSDDKNSTASNTVKEFINSERRTRVPFTPEEDSFIRKGIKTRIWALDGNFKIV